MRWSWGLILFCPVILAAAWLAARLRCRVSGRSLPAGVSRTRCWHRLAPGRRTRAGIAGLTGLRTLFAWPDGYHVLIGLVSPGGELCGASLAGLDLRRHGLLVLAIGRQGRQVHFPKGREILHPGDCLLLYGSPETWRA